MWPAVATGLALLTWLSARPVYASKVSVNDQQLTYQGQGWQIGTGPQTCSTISQTVHTTSTTGDFVTFNFTGNGVLVRGPLTTLSNPTTIILDGNIQLAAIPTNGNDGCGILYANPNITTTLEEHSITLVFSATSGSVQFSISGIIVIVHDSVTTAPASVTQFQIVTSNSILPTLLPGGGPAPTSSPSTATAANVNPIPSLITSTSATPTVSSVANAAPLPPSSPTMSVAVSTSAFVTTSSMTIALIVGIFGTILGMLGLLLVFILLRRRITRNTARKRDQENSFGREAREMEEGNGRAPEESRVPVWSTGGKEGDSLRFILVTGQQRSKDSKIDVSTPPLTVSIPPVASGSGTHPRLSLVAAYPQRVPSTATTYSLPLGPRLLSYSSLSDDVNNGYSHMPERPPLSRGSQRRILTPLSIPIFLSSSHSRPPSATHTPTPPGLFTPSLFVTSHQMSQISSSSTEWSVQPPVKHGPLVTNRAESLGGSSIATRKTSDPPPGYI